MNPQTLTLILQILQIAAGAAQTINNKDVQAGAKLGEDLIAIVQAGAQAYQAHVGQPIDLSVLHRIEPIT